MQELPKHFGFENNTRDHPALLRISVQNTSAYLFSYNTTSVLF